VALRRLSVRRAPWHRAAPPHVPGWWRKLGWRAPGLCVCPEQAVRDDDVLHMLRLPCGEDFDDLDHLDLSSGSDGLFDLVLFNEGGPKRKRAPGLKQVRPQCSEESCSTQARGPSGLCSRHSGEKTKHKQCSEESCSAQARGPSGLCSGHGGEKAKRCSYQGCSAQSRGPSGLCSGHGGEKAKRCSYQGCSAESRGPSGLCSGHGGEKAKVKEARATKAKASEARLAGGTRAYLTAQEEVPPQQASLPGVSDAAGRAAQAEYQHSGDWDAARRVGTRVGTVAAAEAEAREAMLVRRYAAPAAAAARGDFREAHELLVALHTELSANPSTRARYVAAAEALLAELLPHAEGPITEEGTQAALEGLLRDGALLDVRGLGDVRAAVAGVLRERALCEAVAAQRNRHFRKRPRGRGERNRIASPLFDAVVRQVPARL